MSGGQSKRKTSTGARDKHRQIEKAHRDRMRQLMQDLATTVYTNNKTPEEIASMTRGDILLAAMECIALLRKKLAAQGPPRMHEVPPGMMVPGQYQGPAHPQPAHPHGYMPPHPHQGPAPVDIRQASGQGLAMQHSALQALAAGMHRGEAPTYPQQDGGVTMAYSGLGHSAPAQKNTSGSSEQLAPTLQHTGSTFRDAPPAGWMGGSVRSNSSAPHGQVGHNAFAGQVGGDTVGAAAAAHAMQPQMMPTWHTAGGHSITGRLDTWAPASQVSFGAPGVSMYSAPPPAPGHVQGAAHHTHAVHLAPLHGGGGVAPPLPNVHLPFAGGGAAPSTSAGKSAPGSHGPAPWVPPPLVVPGAGASQGMAAKPHWGAAQGGTPGSSPHDVPSNTTTPRHVDSLGGHVRQREPAQAATAAMSHASGPQAWELPPSSKRPRGADTAPGQGADGKPEPADASLPVVPTPAPAVSAPAV